MVTLLCVDDETEALGIRKLLLESEGYTVVTARTHEEASQIWQSSSQKIDLAIIDYWMPGMNGLSLAREVKDAYPGIPIIILPGLGELPGEGDGVVDRWIMKGRSAELLLDAIRKLVQ